MRVAVTLAIGDVFMLAAIIVCGLGYAEGAKLSRVLVAGKSSLGRWSCHLPVMAGYGSVVMAANVR